MNALPNLKRWVLLTALGMGFLADQIVRVPGRPGLSTSLWAIAGSCVLWFLARKRTVGVSGESRILVACATGFAMLIALRDAESLAVLALISAILLLGFAAGRGALAWAHRTNISGVAASAVRVGALLVLGPIGWSIGGARRPANVTASDDRTWQRTALMIGRGVLIGGLPLVLLTSILRSADPVFDQMLHFALSEGLEQFLEHLLFVGWAAWFVSGYLRAFLVDDPILDRLSLPRPGIAPSEIAVALSLLNLLFLAFLAVQTRYLFGGAGMVEVTEGLSYAEYARRGFFELVTATALVVPLLLISDWAAADDGSQGRGVLRVVATLLVVLLAGVLASAAFRMHLYQEAYGLTEERLLVSAIIMWLTGVLGWLALTVLRGRHQGFAFVAVLGGIACIAALHILNPHALIARVNLERAASGAEFDGPYFEYLSADAVPVMIQEMESLPWEVQCRIADILVAGWSDERPGGWRSWNLGDARARRLVANFQRPEECEGLLAQRR